MTRAVLTCLSKWDAAGGEGGGHTSACRGGAATCADVTDPGRVYSGQPVNKMRHRSHARPPAFQVGRDAAAAQLGQRDARRDGRAAARLEGAASSERTRGASRVRRGVFVASRPKHTRV